MKKQINMEIGQRIKQLRENKGLSQIELAGKLQPLIPLMVLDGDTGKQVISQLERGARGLTIEIAIAYSSVFDVSLDYLFLQSEDWRPEYKEAKDIGLSDKSIKVLSIWAKSNDDLEYGFRDLKTLNALLEGIYDVIEKNQGCTIDSVFGHIGRFLYGEFENCMAIDKETHKPVSPKKLDNPYIQMSPNKIFISEKGQDTPMAYDVNKVMETYLLTKITDFIRDLKKKEGE